MKFETKAITFLLCLHWLLVARAAGPYGVDVGWTVDHTSGAIDFTAAMASQLSQGEVGWVRVEAALVKGHTNWDATMLGYYDTVVNNAHNAGLQVLMLIDSAAWPGNQAAWCTNNSENNPGTNGDNAYVENYATNAVVPLVQHFHDRVKAYELWNEPNCWTANPSNGVYTGATYIYPSNFGWLLTRSWEAVHGADQFNDVTLFSGGLFGLNAYGASYSAAGGQYLDDTYNTGTNVMKGGSFAHTKAVYNAYPLDGIGQHMYLSQGGLVSSNNFRQYEDWVHQALTKYEGTNSPKKTFITEFGWQTTNSGNANGVSIAIQDTNLATAFSAIHATPYVQMAIWFDWEDNPAGALWYGVLYSSGVAKPSYTDFQLAERFEGMYPNGTTNVAIQTYYSHLGQSSLGCPSDLGHGPWVTNFLTALAQDYYGGAHSNVTVIASTNGTFELNNLYGFWGYYQANHGGTNYGLPLDNAFTNGSGRRQDFALGCLTWDSVNQVVWHALPSVPASLTATPSNAQVSLVWSPVSGASGYNVKRASVTGGPYTNLANIVAPTNYLDTTVNNGVRYYYVVAATNTAGEGPASVEATALPVAPPLLGVPPWSQTVNQGAAVQFSASASSLAAMTCQWLFNGAPISGAQATNYAIASVQPANLGNYAAVFNNYGGASTSTPALLLVRPWLTFGQHGVLSWSGTYTLERATNILGPFSDLAGAVAPYTNNAATNLQQYFRLEYKN